MTTAQTLPYFEATNRLIASSALVAVSGSPEAIEAGLHCGIGFTVRAYNISVRDGSEAAESKKLLSVMRAVANAITDAVRAVQAGCDETIVEPMAIHHFTYINGVGLTVELRIDGQKNRFLVIRASDEESLKKSV